MSEYYDGTKLLSLLDVNKNKPEIYICSSNRTAGKTYFFSRMIINRYIKKGEKFALLCRNSNEIQDAHKTIFEPVKELFEGHTMKTKTVNKGAYGEIYWDDMSLCGYVLPLRCATKIKKFSNVFWDVTSMMFDEFQLENGQGYLPTEIESFISVHQSVARGNGKQSRYVAVYMLTNALSLLNPYYSELKISSRLKADTKFLRGEGWVMECALNTAAIEAQKESSFNKAFSGNKYIASSVEGVYLNDNLSFIGRPKTRGRYLCSITYNGKNFGVTLHEKENFIYCSDVADMTHPTCLAVDTSSHSFNTILKMSEPLLVKALQKYFELGYFRFKNLECKEVILKLLSY